MRNLILALGALTFSLGANAADFNFTSGYFDSSRHSPDEARGPELQITRTGNQITVLDRHNKITYNLTIGSGEQPLPAKVLENVRSTKGGRVIGTLVQRITVSDVKVVGNNKLSANFNLYIVNPTPFGSLSAKIVVGGEAVSKGCKVTRSNGPPNYESREETINCIETETATRVSVNWLKTEFNSEFNDAMGLIGDTLLKLLSPTFGNLNTYYSYR